jgi:hypothetical protein
LCLKHPTSLFLLPPLLHSPASYAAAPAAAAGSSQAWLSSSKALGSCLERVRVKKRKRRKKRKMTVKFTLITPQNLK